MTAFLGRKCTSLPMSIYEGIGRPAQQLGALDRHLTSDLPQSGFSNTSQPHADAPFKRSTTGRAFGDTTQDRVEMLSIGRFAPLA